MICVDHCDRIHDKPFRMVSLHRTVHSSVMVHFGHIHLMSTLWIRMQHSQSLECISWLDHPNSMDRSAMTAHSCSSLDSLHQMYSPHSSGGTHNREQSSIDCTNVSTFFRCACFYYNQPLNFGKWVIPLNDIPLEDSVRLTLIIYVLVTLVLFFFFFLNQLYNRFWWFSPFEVIELQMHVFKRRKELTTIRLTGSVSLSSCCSCSCYCYYYWTAISFFSNTLSSIQMKIQLVYLYLSVSID